MAVLIFEREYGQSGQPEEELLWRVDPEKAQADGLSGAVTAVWERIVKTRLRIDVTLLEKWGVFFLLNRSAPLSLPQDTGNIWKIISNLLQTIAVSLLEERCDVAQMGI